MKNVIRILILATALVAIAHCFPGSIRDTESSEDNDKKNVDTVLVLPGLKTSGRSVFDLDDSDFDDDSDEIVSPGYFYPFGANPFFGLWGSMQSAMNRLREQMAGVLSHIPDQSIIGSWGKIPEGANTTSTTKIIDGHVVTINETTYTSGDDNHGTVFRVRVVDVKPQNETVEATESQTEVESETVPDDPITPTRSVETVEDFSENEIPKSQVDTLTA